MLSFGGFPGINITPPRRMQVHHMYMQVSAGTAPARLYRGHGAALLCHESILVSF